MEVGAHGVGYVMVNPPHRTKRNRSENNLCYKNSGRFVAFLFFSVHANVRWVDTKYYVSNIQVMSFGCYIYVWSSNNTSPTWVERSIIKQFREQDFGDILHIRFTSFPFHSVLRAPVATRPTWERKLPRLQYSITPHIRTLTIRIGLAFWVNLSKIL